MAPAGHLYLQSSSSPDRMSQCMCASVHACSTLKCKRLLMQRCSRYPVRQVAFELRLFRQSSAIVSSCQYQCAASQHMTAASHAFHQVKLKLLEVPVMQ